MKKWISLVLAASLLLAMTGCGGQNAAGNGGSGADTAADGASAAASAKLPDPASVTMEEQVLVDEAGIKVTATGLGCHAPVGFPEDDDTHNTYHMAFTLENNTDQTLHPEYSLTGIYNGSTTSFAIHAAAEPGSTTADSMGEMDVEPGESRDFVLYLNSLNPDAPVQWAVCFAFDTGETVIGDDGEIISSPLVYQLTDLVPIKTSATDAAPVPRLDPVELFGSALYEDDALAVYARNVRRSTTIFPNGMVVDDYIAFFCCENKTDQWLYVQWKDQTVNGISFDDGSEAGVILAAVPQSFGFSSGVSFAQEDLDSAGIDTLESLTGHLTVYAADALPHEDLKLGGYLTTLPDGAKVLSECDISLDKAWIDAHYSESKSDLSSYGG